jgi:hypothetical protein
MLEDHCDKFSKELYGRNTSHLAGSDTLEDRGKSERVKKSVDCWGEFVLKIIWLCYSCHGMDLLGVDLLSDDTILPVKRLHATSFSPVIIDFSRYERYSLCAKVE